MFPCAKITKQKKVLKVEVGAPKKVEVDMTLTQLEREFILYPRQCFNKI